MEPRDAVLYTQAVEGRRTDLTVVSAGSTVVAEIERFRAEGRPVVIIQLDGETSFARDAGYPMEEIQFCGNTAWQITGPAGTVPRRHRRTRTRHRSPELNSPEPRGPGERCAARVGTWPATRQPLGSTTMVTSAFTPE